MFDVCPKCGLYDEEKSIDPDGPVAICSHCGHGHHFEYLPLLVLTGASGSGKSTVCLAMAAHMQTCVWMEVDLYWRPEFNTPETEYRDFRNLCLRTAKTINQSGRPTVLCGSATPGQYEACPQARYFSRVHYLALVCEQAELRQRLMGRPDWRESSSEAFLNTMIGFNQWFYDQADSIPELDLLDTTGQSLAATCAAVARWVDGCVQGMFLS